MAAERLQKIISNAGVASRRAAEEMILAGRVVVNGTVVTTLGARADAEADTILVDGVPVERSRYTYVLVNKPRGVLSAASDDRGRVAVTELVPEHSGLHPVGRLDLESEGLVLLTNDGQLTNLLTHPRHETEKEYLVQIDGPLAARDAARMARGVESEGEMLRAASVRTVAAAASATDQHWLAIVLREGKKRQIRRMLAAMERRVLVLRRVRMGPIGLGDLKPGQWRLLTDAEVQRLYAAATRTKQ